MIRLQLLLEATIFAPGHAVAAVEVEVLAGEWSWDRRGGLSSQFGDGKAKCMRERTAV
jgi:hypothetical protein